jgi:membrane-bound serine protease (ClpP class)
MKAQPLLFVILPALFLPALGQVPSPGSAPEAVPEKTRPLVYEIPIRNQIEPALLYVIRRGVSEAVREQADAVVFSMDTPGGRVDVTRDILDIIRRIDVPVYTFIERDAYSAGAIIALGTPHIYMAPGSVIGAATPMMMSPGGGVQDLNEDVSEKMKSGVAAMVRAAAEQGGHDPELAEAMVRRETEYKIGSHVVSAAGELLTLTASEAEGNLSSGTVANVEAMLEAAGLPDAQIIKMEVTPAERIARVIAALAPILMMVGLGGIYLEIKTPGFGLPGIAGAAALALFFFGHHIAGLAGMEDIVLFIIGFALLFTEVFITPGFGLLGIGGIVLVFVSLLNAMTWQIPGELLPALSGSGATLERALGKLALGLAGTVVAAVYIGKKLPTSRAARPLVLSQSTGKTDGFTAARDQSGLLNREGVTEMNLHPAGRAVIDGDRVNVITHGEFIEKGARIRVIEAHGSRILVEKADV